MLPQGDAKQLVFNNVVLTTEILRDHAVTSLKSCFCVNLKINGLNVSINTPLQFKYFKSFIENLINEVRLFLSAYLKSGV